MDWIRHEYTSMMRFYADDLESVVPIQWYFVPESNKVMPYHSPFRSREDIRFESDTQVLGEDLSTIRRHRAGTTPQGSGLTFCGSQQQWEQGCSVSDTIPPINTKTGLPCCCGPAPYVSSGGALFGGTGIDTNFLLQENGFLLLQEDGSRIIWN